MAVFCLVKFDFIKTSEGARCECGDNFVVVLIYRYKIEANSENFYKILI